MSNNNSKRIACTLLTASVTLSSMGLTGCGKTVPCNVKDNHAHYYVNEYDMGRYIVSEKETKHGLQRTDNYISINPDDKELYDFLDKKGLFRIDENIDAINSICEKNVDYLEYYFSYSKLVLTPLPGMDGGIDYLWTPKTESGWTTDPTHEGLTGETKTVHYMYYGYKVEKDEKGNYILIRSDLVDSIEDLPLGFDYITKTFYKEVDLDNVLENTEGKSLQLKKVSNL